MKSVEVVSAMAGHLEGMGHVALRAVAPGAESVGSETQWFITSNLLLSSELIENG